MFSNRSEARNMAAVKELSDKARLVGINHVALEVGSIEEALAFYGRLFEFSLRGRSAKIAFIDLGDQFINISEGRTQPPDKDRHFARTRGGVQGPVGKPRANRGVREYPVHQA